MNLEIYVSLLIVVAIALFFALTNGLHDASSVVATLIACGAATPSQAVVLAAVFGFAGAVFSGSAVAKTMTQLKEVSIHLGYTVDALHIIVVRLI